MKTTLLLKLCITLGVISLSLSACGASTPSVELGYLYSDNYNQVPTAFVDYEPGMTISAITSPQRRFVYMWLVLPTKESLTPAARLMHAIGRLDVYYIQEEGKL